MKMLQRLAAIAALAFLTATAFAQQYDTVGGGARINITAGNIDGTAGGGLFVKNLGGTITNDNATAGSIGEVLQSTVIAGSAVSLSNATAANVTSLALTAGDWEVFGACDHTWTGTTATVEVCGIGTVTATQPTQPGVVTGTVTLGTEPLMSQSVTFGTTITGRYDQRVQSRVQVAAGGGTIFLVATATFSAGTDAVFGTLRARRIR